jgi:UDP:flavonoid glycosyltransferase YjiC (YdhE family)
MKILVAGWDSGGGVEAVQTVVGRAVARGHQVRVLGTEGLRARFESAGATFLRYKYAPDNDMRQPETDLVKDWQTRNPLTQWRRVRDRQLCGPAREFCRDVAEELQREPADVAVVDTMIPAALFGAEVAGVRAVIVMHGPYAIPRSDVPPLGTGLMPAKGPLGRLRDRSAAAVALAVFRSGMPALNQTRAEVGLPPVRDLPGLMARADRVLVCSSPSYDFGSGSVPANVCYVGPQLDDQASGASTGPWADAPGQPLVLVGLSSTVMRQEGLLQRAADALGQLPVRGLVTTGPAVDPAVISAPDNVTVTRWVRHADVLPHCSAVITHGRSRHRDEGLDRRRPAGPGATGARPARQRRPGSTCRCGHTAAQECNRQRAAGRRRPGHRRSPLPRGRTADGGPAGQRTRRQPRRRRAGAGSRPRTSGRSSCTRESGGQLASAPCSASG